MCVCAGGERREEGGERNRCTRQRDADRRGSFSFFSPLPLPSPFVRLPRYVCTVLSLSFSLSFCLSCLLLSLHVFLSVCPRTSRGILRCEFVYEPLSPLDLRGFISNSDVGTTGSEGCRSRMFDHSEIRR